MLLAAVLLTLLGCAHGVLPCAYDMNACIACHVGAESCLGHCAPL